MSKITPVTLTVAGTDISFHPTVVAYNSYLNDVTMTDKVAPSHNYLTKIVAPESKPDLTELLKLPGAALQIAGKLNDLFAPQLDITVKN
ncbi:putative phage tail assembly chaperone [Aeromonas hydrophila]|uniref:putative phage tail assembly chaperone n=1 Tax=Aeromonas hydrophila TaxID=644 RepID=UPI003D1DC048